MQAAMEETVPDHIPKWQNKIFEAFSSTKDLEQFSTINAKRLFSILGLRQTILAKDTSEWNEDAAFQESLRIINRLVVVNDRAERGVASHSGL